ncbi:TPA: hypothetical protein ACHIYE_002493, partial [Enterococcus faecium]
NQGIIGNPSLNHRYRKGFYSLFKTLQQNRPFFFLYFQLSQFIVQKCRTKINSSQAYQTIKFKTTKNIQKSVIEY